MIKEPEDIAEDIRSKWEIGNHILHVSDEVLELIEMFTNAIKAERENNRLVLPDWPSNATCAIIMYHDENSDNKDVPILVRKINKLDEGDK